MHKPNDPRELAESILLRSVCHVQVGAVLADTHGIYGWSWNSVGPTGLGIHAEIHCLRRSNKRRWRESTMYVAAVRKKSRSVVTAKPCEDCAKAVVGRVGKVVYRDKEGWKELCI